MPMLYVTGGWVWQDAAVVEAARLSHRYVSGRKLPDKAIDLLDEACANVRVDLDSKPEVRTTGPDGLQLYLGGKRGGGCSAWAEAW